MSSSLLRATASKFQVSIDVEVASGQMRPQNGWRELSILFVTPVTGTPGPLPDRG